MKPFNIALTVLGIVALSMAIFTLCSRMASKKQALLYEFNGKVDTVSYNEKGEPTITIHGIKYNLAVTRWDFDHQIQAGDSLVKKRDSMVVKIFKSDGTYIIKQ